MGKKILHGIGVGLGAAAVALAFWYSGLFNRWEWATWGWRVRTLARAPSPRIKLILLDQASLDWGKNESGLSWPWPREVYGAIIDFCRRGGAKALAFDVLYTEPSVYGVADDQALEAAIKRSPPFAGSVALSRTSAGVDAWPDAIPAPRVTIAGLDSWLDGGPTREELVYSSAIFPIPEAGAAAGMLGNVIDAPDPDSIFRRAALFGVFDGQAVPSLGLAAFLVAPDQDGRTPDLGIDGGSLSVGGKRVPLNAAGRAILRFRGRTGVYGNVSAAAVIQSELRLREGAEAPLDPEMFRDCYVFFGFSAPGLLDLRATPLNPVAPGVLVHATVLDNLLTNGFLRDAPAPFFISVTALIALGAGIGVCICKKAFQSVLVSLVFLPLPWLVGFIAYPLGLWWPIVGVEGAVVLSLVGAIVLNYATEGRQKAFIKSAFKYYLSAAVIERLIADPAQLQLGGERRELSIFFSDLQGFSGISERLNPVELTALLNDFLSDMTDIILEEGGTLDKYEGDAILAFWNAPLTQGNHAKRAVRAGLRCQRKLGERRAEFEKRTGAELHMRIGINTGEVVVGNMGSRDRFDYTVLGDAANLASRLEGANKALGTYFMVSESTWRKTEDSFVGRELGQLRVVGRKTPVRVFEPLGFAGDGDIPGREDFEKGLALCYEGKWKAALAIFESLGDEPAARVYARRCRELIEKSGENWDGVWNLTAK